MAGVFSIANPVVERGHRHEADLQKPRDYKRAAYKQDNAATPKRSNQ